MDNKDKLVEAGKIFLDLLEKEFEGKPFLYFSILTKDGRLYDKHFCKYEFNVKEVAILLYCFNRRMNKYFDDEFEKKDLPEKKLY